MKTTIKTTELLKILEPINDGVIYKNQIIKLDLEILGRYVNNPKNYKIFESAPTTEEAFYKNLALYIINSNYNHKFVQLDLNKEKSIENGLFEFVKNIFNEEKLTYIQLPEDGDNLLFIQSKNLQELPITESSIVEKAIDIELGGRTSVFLKTKKIIEKEKFFWTAQESGRYSDTDFLVNKLLDASRVIDFSKNNNRDENNNVDKEFFNILKVSDQKLINSDEFKLTLLKSEYKNIYQVLVNDSQPKIFSIDFSSDFVRDFILEQTDAKDFSLLGIIFKQNSLAKRQNSYEWVKDAVKDNKMKFETVHNVQFNTIINHPNTIDFLLKQRVRELNINGDDDNFSIVSAYPYFSKENKVNPDIVNKFLASICSNRHSDIRIQENKINLMPMSLYNEPYFLEQICMGIEFDKVKSRMKAHDIEPILLSDKNFIAKNCSKVPGYGLLKWISSFISKEEINKEFLLSIVKIKPIFCETIMSSSSSLLKQFSNDKDIIFTASSYGFDITKISTKLMKKFFLEDDNEQYELLKIKYLIENREYNSWKDFFKDSEQSKKFEDKYLKSEFMYFSKDDYFYENKIREKIQNNFKTPEEILNVLEKIKQTPYNYKFKADFFYKELPNNLQSNKKIVDKIFECNESPFPFSSLHESLQYNSELALKFIKIDPKNTLDVSKEFFNDINFSLEFSKLIDARLFKSRESLIPEFITKFFDNQGIQENYHEKLTHYVSVFSLKEALDKTPVSLVQKKAIKI